MNKIDEELQNFLSHWFTGLMQGIEELGQSDRQNILHRCGQACAQSYTVQLFREVKQNSSDMPSFLQNLSQAIPDATYEQNGRNTIQVTYSQCGCDLVGLGLVKSPDFCECTVANLRENFQAAFNEPVSVTLETSILQGADQCRLAVKLANEMLE